jgi:hypothetical protein
VGNSLRLPDITNDVCQLLVIFGLRHRQIAGNPSELQVPRMVTKVSSGQEQTLGMVIILKIGQSAAKPLKNFDFMGKVQRLHGDGSLYEA